MKCVTPFWRLEWSFWHQHVVLPFHKAQLLRMLLPKLKTCPSLQALSSANREMRPSCKKFRSAYDITPCTRKHQPRVMHTCKMARGKAKRGAKDGAVPPSRKRMHCHASSAARVEGIHHRSRQLSHKGQPLQMWQ